MTPPPTNQEWLRPRDHEASAWANGRGRTRELARGPSWRLSIAELTENAPFSPFLDVDRLFVLVSGRVDLRIDGNVRTMVPGDTAAFPGEAAVSVVVDRPAQAVNLMARRGEHHFETRGEVDVLDLAPSHHEFVVLISPARTADGEILEAGSTWDCVSDPSDALRTLQFTDPTSLCRVRLRSGPFTSR